MPSARCRLCDRFTAKVPNGVCWPCRRRDALDLLAPLGLLAFVAMAVRWVWVSWC